MTDVADVDAAIRYMLQFEDASLSGVVTTDPKDPGGRTRFGIAAKYHPELSASTFYTTMGNGPALNLAYGIYRSQYANKLCIAEIGSHAVANKVMLHGVNPGIERVSRWLEAAVLMPQDGVIGVRTLMALSDADPDTVVNELRKSAEQFYRWDVQEHPQFEKYLDGWLNRARA